MNEFDDHDVEEIGAHHWPVESAVVNEEYRAAAIRLHDFMRRVFMAIKEFRGDRAFAFDSMCLALGYTDIVGCDSHSELARRWMCERENVRKLVAEYQAKCDIPKTTWQSDKEKCRKLSVTRKKQLKGKNEKHTPAPSR